MQANYQPIVIRSLLESGGKATKDDIAKNQRIQSRKRKSGLQEHTCL